MNLFLIYQFFLYLLCLINLSVYSMEEFSFPLNFDHIVDDLLKQPMQGILKTEEKISISEKYGYFLNNSGTNINAHDKHTLEDLKNNASACTSCKACIETLEKIVEKKECVFCPQEANNQSIHTMDMRINHFLAGTTMHTSLYSKYKPLITLLKEAPNCTEVATILYYLKLKNSNDFSQDDIKQHVKHNLEDVLKTQETCKACQECLDKIKTLNNAETKKCGECSASCNTVFQKIAHMKKACSSKSIELHPFYEYANVHKNQVIKEFLDTLLATPKQEDPLLVTPEQEDAARALTSLMHINRNQVQETALIDEALKNHRDNHTYDTFQNNEETCEYCAHCISALTTLIQEKKCIRCNKQFVDSRRQLDFKKAINHFIDKKNCEQQNSTLNFYTFKLFYDRFDDSKERPKIMTPYQSHLGITPHRRNTTTPQKRKRKEDFTGTSDVNTNDSSPENSANESESLEENLTRWDSEPSKEEITQDLKKVRALLNKDKPHPQNTRRHFKNMH